MTTASFLLRAGISLAVLSALPLFANADASLMNLREAFMRAVATSDFSPVAQRAIAAADAQVKANGLFSESTTEVRVKDLSYVVRILKKGDGVVYVEDWLSLQDNAYDQVFEMGSALSPSSTNLR